MIVPLHRGHSARMAELHCAALAGDFLPRLGQNFLNVFYRGVLEQGTGFGFGALEGNRVNGFVLGSVDSGLLFKRAVLGDVLSLGWSAAPAVLRQPGLLANIFQTFLYPRKEGKIPEKAELVVIAMEAACRRRGLGRQLVEALNNVFRARGIASYKVSVLQSREEANRFYLALGFQPVLEFELYGKKWNLYRYAI